MSVNKIENSKKRTLTRVLSLIIMVAVLTANYSCSEEVKAAISKPSGLAPRHGFAVIDARTGEFLMGDNPDRKIYPASTTKLMTAIVISEKASMKKKIKITKAMLKQVPKDLSKYGLKSGKTYTVETLLNLSLISSAGDATICAAIGVFGSAKKCVNAMNNKVKKMGLKKTHFDNPGGLDVGNGYYHNYSTPREIAQITRYAMGKDIIKSITAKAYYTAKDVSGKTGKVAVTTNKFYTSIPYSSAMYRIIGSKTGTTKAAGYVFSATAIDQEGREVICAYMGRKSSDDTFKDIKNVLDKVYSANKKSKLNISTGDVKFYNLKKEYKYKFKKNGKIILTAKLRDKETSIKLGKQTGKISYISSNKKVATISSKGVVSFKKEGITYLTIKMKSTPYFKTTIFKIKFTLSEPDRKEDAKTELDKKEDIKTGVDKKEDTEISESDKDSSESLDSGTESVEPVTKVKEEK